MLSWSLANGIDPNYLYTSYNDHRCYDYSLALATVRPHLPVWVESIAYPIWCWFTQIVKEYLNMVSSSMFTLCWEANFIVFKKCLTLQKRSLVPNTVILLFTELNPFGNFKVHKWFNSFHLNSLSNKKTHLSGQGRPQSPGSPLNWGDTVHNYIEAIVSSVKQFQHLQKLNE